MEITRNGVETPPGAKRVVPGAVYSTRWRRGAHSGREAEPAHRLGQAEH
jgi:hypothetical protein